MIGLHKVFKDIPLEFKHIDVIEQNEGSEGGLPEVTRANGNTTVEKGVIPEGSVHLRVLMNSLYHFGTLGARADDI